MSTKTASADSDLNARDAGREVLSAGVRGVMKWYGWGAEGQAFDPIGRPNLWPYAKAHLGISEAQPVSRPVDACSIELPAARAHPAFIAEIEAALGADRWSAARMDRLVHAYGKSTRDLWRARHGHIAFAPDYVLFPDTEEQIVAILKAADRHGVAVVPFGGGSNVAGCLEMHVRDGRTVATVNLRRYNRVLAVDKRSGAARVQAGILGPDLEAALAAEGLTLGHIPDSFPFSTLGGWIATRSSGMLSDGYGNVEDMVLSLRMATPAGFVTTRDAPHAASGPDPKRLCIGSEGALGIITEVTLCVREAPQRRAFHGYLFPDFASGLEAMRACMRAGERPALARLNDPAKTQLSAAFQRKPGALKRAVARGFKWWLSHIRGLDLDQACLMIAAFEGDPATLEARRARVERIYRRHGAVALGRSPGESFAEGKFDFPYIRDFLMDYDVLVDVAETATVWSEIPALYEAGMRTFREALGEGGRHAWVGCHVSHSYPAGASVYFSLAMTCARDADGRVEPWGELERFVAAKHAALDLFAARGATLSHHHAVGYEHLPWLATESPVGPGTVVDAVKATLDPNGVMNPGKLSGRAWSKAQVAGRDPAVLPPAAE